MKALPGELVRLNRSFFLTVKPKLDTQDWIRFYNRKESLIKPFQVDPPSKRLVNMFTALDDLCQNPHKL